MTVRLHKSDTVVPWIQYRFPFLLVDRVIEYNPGESAVAIKNVTINDNFFPGHFPERPIMPGVLMVEVRMSRTTPFTFTCKCCVCRALLLHILQRLLFDQDTDIVVV